MVDRIFNDIVQLYLQCDGGPAHLYRAAVPVLVHYCQHHRDVLRGNIILIISEAAVDIITFISDF